MEKPFVSAVVLACGNASRFGGDKIFALISDKTVLEMSVSVFQENENINEIVVVTRADLSENVEALLKGFSKVTKVIVGGENRMMSALNGVKAVDEKSDFVAIHDGARPLLKNQNLNEVIENAVKYGASILALPVTDTIKVVDAGVIKSTPDRNELMAAQTPQVFKTEKYRSLILRAVESGKAFTDDSSIFEYFGEKVYITESDKTNIKITYKEDVSVAKEFLGRSEEKMRIGHGYDVHRLAENRKLILGGVEIPFEKGLLGHSDADVLIHAIMDSLLGAAALGDIGKLFPDTDESYKGADSIELLKRVFKRLSENGFSVVNIDATVCAEKPKLRPYIDEMRENIAKAIGKSVEDISIKATTEEGLGFTGKMEGISATAVCIIENK